MLTSFGACRLTPVRTIYKGILVGAVVIMRGIFSRINIERLIAVSTGPVLSWSGKQPKRDYPIVFNLPIYDFFTISTNDIMCSVTVVDKT